PHARGDGPDFTGLDTGDLRQAPRTWGWTAGLWEHCARTVAGPTHVGMDRRMRAAGPCRGSRPHARGDGPAPTPHERAPPQQAPRTWGWTATHCHELLSMRAGPTHVGMDRRAFPRRPGGGRRPHARGDGPTCLPPTTWRRTQAPRTWGWTATTSFVELL